jgi:protein FAM50
VIFSNKVRKDLCGSFKELNSVAADALLYVKEDLIIPQDLTFYDLIATRRRQVGTALSFDVHDDGVGTIDTRIEKDESHPGKVVERRCTNATNTSFRHRDGNFMILSKITGGYTIHGVR